MRSVGCVSIVWYLVDTGCYVCVSFGAPKKVEEKLKKTLVGQG